MLGIDYDDPNAVLAHSERLSQRMGELIEICMIEHGFRYEPFAATTRIRFAENEQPGSLEWRQRYGLGAATLHFAQWQVGPDMVGFPSDPPLTHQRGESFSDYIQSLSAIELEAYELALRGTSSDSPLTGKELRNKIQDSDSCQARAARESTANDPYYVAVEAFGHEIAEIGVAIEGDSRVVDFERKLADCLASKVSPGPPCARRGLA